MMLGATPVSQNPCRMNMSELKELHIQLEEILEKGCANCIREEEGWFAKNLYRLQVVLIR
jgi:hypothetical protein